MPREAPRVEVDDEFPEDKPQAAVISSAIGDVSGMKERSLLERMFASQAFWVTMAVLAMCLVMSWLAPTAFATVENFYNITRNFAFIGIMALGMTVVIITGGIDLSVGSILGIVAIVAGLILQAGYAWWLAFAGGFAAGLVAGAINGALIAYVGLPSFVVTLGMLQAGRSAAVVMSQNKMITDFGPDAETVYAIGGGQVLGLANPMWVLLFMAVGTALVLHLTAWGRYLFAIGGNENAARLTGVPVARIKFQAYLTSAGMAGIASLLLLGFNGSAINAVGTGYELRVIASTVIGGANLMGGEGGSYAAFIGSALIEVIRNSLLMAGVDSNWQGIFVGVFIVLAVLLEKIRGRKRN